VNCIPGHRLLWVFDFDGTLSPIVPDRAAARLHRECERMLRFLARSPWNRVAVLSSRTLDDVGSRVPVPGVFIGGASGLEWRFPGGHRSGT
jgi:trehalose 6-phosphate phosphatase